MRTLATVDIGSNTAHLLIARTDGRRLTRMVNRSEWLSLGEIVSAEQELPESTVKDVIQALQRFKALAQAEGAEPLTVFATEAVRAAANHSEALDQIEQATGLRVELASPRREAELGVLGASLDTQFCGATAYVEAGGGSIQIAHTHGDAILEERSLPLGTGRLIATFGLGQPCPPTTLERLERFVDETLDGAEFAPVPRVVASGGVARGLWRALHPDGDRALALPELDYIVWSAQRLRVSQIVGRFSVKEKRAATLLPGAVAYRAILRRLGAAEMTVSSYGVREGALLEQARNGGKR